jgi:hypothetical protein
MFPEAWSRRGRLTRRWAAMHTVRALIALVCVSLCGCSSEWLFQRHVYAGSGQATLKAGEKLNCMGCPAYFHFVADDAAMESIIAAHQLSVVESLPDCLRIRIELGARELAWWKPPENGRVFGVCYQGIEERFAPEFRLLVAYGEEVFFATSLHFNPQLYKRTF